MALVSWASLNNPMTDPDSGTASKRCTRGRARRGRAEHLQRLILRPVSASGSRGAGTAASRQDRLTEHGRPADLQAAPSVARAGNVDGATRVAGPGLSHRTAAHKDSTEYRRAGRDRRCRTASKYRTVLCLGPRVLSAFGADNDRTWIDHSRAREQPSGSSFARVPAAQPPESVSAPDRAILRTAERTGSDMPVEKLFPDSLPIVVECRPSW